MKIIKEIRIKSEKIDFNNLYKIIKINIDKVTFRKCSIKRLMSENKGEEIIEIGKDIGDETYYVSGEVSKKLVGRVGDIIKEFKTELQGKKKKKLVVVDVIEVL